MAVASLVLGIIALIGGLTGWAGVVCGILAIVFGAVGRKDKAHKTMATWGLVLGVIALLRRTYHRAFNRRRDFRGSCRGSIIF